MRQLPVRDVGECHQNDLRSDQVVFIEEWTQRQSMKPVINKRRCSAQKDICTALKVCSPGAIQYVEDEEEPLGGRIVIDYGVCDECGLCATACCGQAIDMKSVEQ